MQIKDYPIASIIVPVKDNNEGLLHLIRSLEGQTTQDFELIIVDDCSKPPVVIPTNSLNTPKLLRLKKNVGQALARNIGANEAKGLLIIFIDSDCIPNFNWISTYLKLYSKGQKVIASSFSTTSDGNVVANLRSDESEFYHIQDTGYVNCFTTSNVAIDADLFHKCRGFPNIRVGEDFLLGYKLFNMGKSVYWHSNNKVQQNNRSQLSAYLSQQFEWAKAAFAFRLMLPFVSNMKWNVKQSSLKLQILLALAALISAPISLWFMAFWYLPLIFITLTGVLNVPFVFFVYRRRGIVASIASLAFIMLLRNPCWAISLIRVVISPLTWIGFLRAKALEIIVLFDEKKREKSAKSSISFLIKTNIISKYS